jgi:hypothetical protein
MFRRMTGTGRIAAGRMIALLYLFCVLVPSVALAAGTGPAAIHSHDAGTSHSHEHAGITHHQLADASKSCDGHQHDHGKGGPGPCCVMLCTPGLTADLPQVASPPPSSACSAESDRNPRGEAPARLHRPPIA